MDYANRKPKSPKRKPAKKKGSNKKQQRGAKPVGERKAVPWFVVIIAIGLIALFTYILVQISGKSEEVEQPHVQQPPADLLPEKSAERWRYIEELESKEVEVDVPEREVGPPKLMQCGSFRQQADAERLRAQIAMAGLESQVRATDGSNGLWYRVILGPY